MKSFISEMAAFQFSSMRALLYTAESLPLPVLNRIISGKEVEKPTAEQQAALIQLGRDLISRDAKDFAEGIYPWSVYRPYDSIFSHGPRWARVMLDGAVSSYRRRKNKIKEFSRDADDVSRFPEYYRRNFHHQTDGYLSEFSAEIYEHQVELLFRGLAQPMRRRLLRPMVEHLGEGDNLHILEYACGSGAFTRQLAEVFPKAQITSVDLSPSYVKHARNVLSDKKNVNFLVADAENLPFKDATFDAVVGVYLHHELPRDVRKNVCRETLRVVKPEGFWGLVDSLQLGDIPELDWALRQFPKTFHEPFYKDYIGYPLRDLVRELNLGFTPKEESHFFSKVVYHHGKGSPSQE